MPGREHAPGLRAPMQPRIANDPEVDRVLRDHARCLTELQKLIAAGARIIPNVVLADGVSTPVSHKLGRSPLIVLPSAVRGTTALTGGVVHEVQSTSFDRRDILVLRATGYGASVTADIMVL